MVHCQLQIEFIIIVPIRTDTDKVLKTVIKDQIIDEASKNKLDMRWQKNLFSVLFDKNYPQKSLHSILFFNQHLIFPPDPNCHYCHKGSHNSSKSRSMPDSPSNSCKSLSSGITWESSKTGSSVLFLNQHPIFNMLPAAFMHCFVNTQMEESGFFKITFHSVHRQAPHPYEQSSHETLEHLPQ